MLMAELTYSEELCFSGEVPVSPEEKYILPCYTLSMEYMFQNEAILLCYNHHYTFFFFCYPNFTTVDECSTMQKVAEDNGLCNTDKTGLS